MNEVKFSVFADIHHAPGYFYTDAPARLEKIRARAVENNVDFVIHCGDFCREPDKEADFMAQYAAFPIPVYHCLGNHDNDLLPFHEILRGYGLKTGYYYFDCKGFRFIVLDLNYMKVNGRAVHYEKGNYFHTPEKEALVTFPPFEREWMEKVVLSSPYPCILFSHQSFEREHNDMLPAEREKIRQLFARLNRDKKRIFLAINGHFHRNNLRIVDGIAYFDLNSASYDWIPGKQHKGKFPEEIYREFCLADHTVIYEDPVHAIVTVREDGRIRIEGMESRFFCGVDHASVGADPRDEDGRPCVPEVLSATIRVPV